MLQSCNIGHASLYLSSMYARICGAVRKVWRSEICLVFSAGEIIQTYAMQTAVKPQQIYGLHFFFVFFTVSFLGFVSRFLAEVVFTALFWSSDLHLRGTCSTLEFGSLALAWCLQHFGAWISHSTGICNILELGSLMVFASGWFTVSLKVSLSGFVFLKAGLGTF